MSVQVYFYLHLPPDGSKLFAPLHHHLHAVAQVGRELTEFAGQHVHHRGEEESAGTEPCDNEAARQPFLVREPIN